MLMYRHRTSAQASAHACTHAHTSHTQRNENGLKVNPHIDGPIILGKLNKERIFATTDARAIDFCNQKMKLGNSKTKLRRTTLMISYGAGDYCHL